MCMQCLGNPEGGVWIPGTGVGSHHVGAENWTQILWERKLQLCSTKEWMFMHPGLNMWLGFLNIMRTHLTFFVVVVQREKSAHRFASLPSWIPGDIAAFDENSSCLAWEIFQDNVLCCPDGFASCCPAPTACGSERCQSSSLGLPTESVITFVILDFFMYLQLNLVRK